MRFLSRFLLLTPLITGVSFAQGGGQGSATSQLKETVGEWIGVMREIQQEESSWDRDQQILEDQRSALETEIAQLEEQIAAARTSKQGADQESSERIERRDALKAAKETLAARVAELEDTAVGLIPVLPGPLRDDPRVAQLVTEITKSEKLSGDEANSGLAKRLNNVLNLLAEAEGWQQTVHLRDQLMKGGDSREFNMKVVYFGLGNAYAVNETGDLAMVGRPADSGWTFEERNDLAPDITRLVAVLNGDTDAQFVPLPIDLP